MNKPFGGLILNIAFRMLVPFTMVYAVYILCLGEFSPGGGFQAGRCSRRACCFPVSFWALIRNSMCWEKHRSCWPVSAPSFMH